MTQSRIRGILAGFNRGIKRPINLSAFTAHIRLNMDGLKYLVFHPSRVSPCLGSWAFQLGHFLAEMDRPIQFYGKNGNSSVSHGKPKKIKCKRLAIHLHQMTFSGRACSQKYLQALAREPSSGYYRSFHKRHLQLQLPYPSDAHPSKKVHGRTHFDLFSSFCNQPLDRTPG